MLEEEKKKRVLTAVIIICAIFVVVSVIMICVIIYRYYKDNQRYEEIEQEYTKIDDGKWYNMINVDVLSLKQQNHDTCGWIFFENEDISYPVMQTTNNDKYLTTAFDGTSSKAGSIFMDMRNKSAFTDDNSILYGHNMADLSMFGKLNNYKSDNLYYQDHLYYQLITEDRICRYQIFAFNDVSDTSKVYTCRFTSDSDKVKFIRDIKMISQQIIEAPHVSTSTNEDEVLLTNYPRFSTLSTCTERDDMRFVVVGVLVGEYDRTSGSVLYDASDIK